MFEKMIDDLKARAGTQVRLTSLAAGAAVTALITFAFLCAAGFVHVYRHYGLIEACLAGAGVFFFITVLIGGYAMAQRAEAERQAAAARLAAKSEPSLLQSALTDPLVLATGLQIVRAVGIRRLVPIVAVAGVGLGLWAGAKRGGADGDVAKEDRGKAGDK